MLNFIVGLFVGRELTDRRAIETTAPQSGASGWIGAFLILIAILAWGMSI
jgi:hypothetical protein